ncbi:sensor histidine kinase RegB [Jannaschia sp. KMU-145]|uniref:sensor histidine kinase RegB n=1 Tax=Jannaschia halovivens TaxID=3388667 RepID=UPI00396B12C0
MPTQPTRSLLPPEAHRHGVRLETLVNLRWFALLGQSVTVIVAVLGLGFDVPLYYCAGAIAAGALANIVAAMRAPASGRLTEGQAFAFLLFDQVQLTALLFVTGGLHNPFALLFIAPVTISATALGLRPTLALGAVAIAFISLLGGYHLPLRMQDGTVLGLAPMQLAGSWVAIVVGTLFLSGFAFRLTRETGQLASALLATQTALAREQKLQDLGGVVAAAAHELNTPLATIKLVSSELVEELADRPDLRDDVALVRSQADRCRDILRSMGRTGKSDRHLEAAPIEAVLREAAGPHLDRGIDVEYDLQSESGQSERQPQIQRRPEVIHGMRNLIQNAVDFAETSVWVDVRWTPEILTVRVTDDGAGFMPEVLPRLGNPFLRSRNRPGYEGMGLGLFISKTLLERTGARVAFANATRPGRARPRIRGGAVAEVTWPRSAIEAPIGPPLGDNAPLAS